MLSYPSAMSLSSSTLRYLADLLRRHRRRIPSPWRRLSASRQALLVLAHLRNGDMYEQLACGFGVGVATVCRYIHEAVGLLARRAPSLQAALWRVCSSLSNYLVVDGTVIATDRLAAYDRLYFSGKHRHHGLNHQGLIDHAGRLVWISPGLPGSVHDVIAARTHRMLSTCRRAGVMVLGDKGYQGDSCGTVTPYKGRELPESYRQANRAHAHVRGPGERGFATLSHWHVLNQLRCCPLAGAYYAPAILTLENQE